jgi:hypothetical protein
MPLNEEGYEIGWLIGFERFVRNSVPKKPGMSATEILDSFYVDIEVVKKIIDDSRM